MRGLVKMVAIQPSWQSDRKMKKEGELPAFLGHLLTGMTEAKSWIEANV